MVLRILMRRTVAIEELFFSFEYSDRIDKNKFLNKFQCLV